MSIWDRIRLGKTREPLALVLYTRESCPLCDEMKRELSDFMRRDLASRCALREVDVDSDPALAARYGRSVPVLEIAGRPAFKGRLTAQDLRRKVDRALRGATSE